jgi:hypothetical protein
MRTDLLNNHPVPSRSRPANESAVQATRVYHVVESIAELMVGLVDVYGVKRVVANGRS